MVTPEEALMRKRLGLYDKRACTRFCLLPCSMCPLCKLLNVPRYTSG